MSRRLSDIVTSVTAAQPVRGEGWRPTIRIAGRENGKPFVLVVDLLEVTYPDETAAIAAGEQAARDRVKALQALGNSASAPRSPLY